MSQMSTIYIYGSQLNTFKSIIRAIIRLIEVNEFDDFIYFNNDLIIQMVINEL